VAATVPVGAAPYGVAVTPDGSSVYVVNAAGNTASVIATAATRLWLSSRLGMARLPWPERRQGLCRECAEQYDFGDRDIQQ
jgi:DNA-binding beta-propeller fold protein YncE